MYHCYNINTGIKIIYNLEVIKLQETATTDMQIIGIKNKKKTSFIFEKVINASGYNSVLLNSSIGANFPFSMATTYQPCIALVFNYLDCIKFMFYICMFIIRFIRTCHLLVRNRFHLL